MIIMIVCLFCVVFTGSIVYFSFILVYGILVSLLLLFVLYLLNIKQRVDRV